MVTQWSADSISYVVQTSCVRSALAWVGARDCQRHWADILAVCSQRVLALGQTVSGDLAEGFDPSSMLRGAMSEGWVITRSFGKCLELDRRN